jgi:transcriptional regulator GlxA family with amidase domain
MRLTRRARRRGPAPPLLPESASSPTSVADLADWLGTSTRSMRERFHREVGLSPKRMLRVERLHAALHAARCASRSFAEIAQLAGYADQAHFTREVRALLGETPSAWQARASAVSFKTPAEPIA